MRVGELRATGDHAVRAVDGQRLGGTHHREPQEREARSARLSLIELLTVIAIIGILASMLIPAVGAVRQQAAQAKSASNLRQIALAYNNYATAGGRTRVIGQGTYSSSTPTVAADMKEWALVLAQGAGLVDAAIYTIDGDPQLATVPELPLLIGARQPSRL